MVTHPSGGGVGGWCLGVAPRARGIGTVGLERRNLRDRCGFHSPDRRSGGLGRALWGVALFAAVRSIAVETRDISGGVSRSTLVVLP